MILGNSGASLLVVEDDVYNAVMIYYGVLDGSLPDSLLVVTEKAEAIGYLVEDHSTKARPGLILLDLGIPGNAAFQILNWVQQQPRLADLPIVVWAAPGVATLEPDKALALGAREFLPKPATRHSILSALQQLCDRYAAGDRTTPDLPGISNPVALPLIPDPPQISA